MAKLYKYRVSLPGIKGFARVYLMSPETSLYAFHKAMRADMDFPLDQIVLFKAVTMAGEALARFSVKDLGQGTIDAVTLLDCHCQKWDHFHYFYDTTNRKSVLVDFVEEISSSMVLTVPFLLEAESKGPNPIEFEMGYVALEDMAVEKRKKLMLGVDGEDDDYEDFEDEEEEDEYGTGEEVYGDGEDMYDGE
jgi:hypothetical protein